MKRTRLTKAYPYKIDRKIKVQFYCNQTYHKPLNNKKQERIIYKMNNYKKFFLKSQISPFNFKAKSRKMIKFRIKTIVSFKKAYNLNKTNKNIKVKMKSI